MKEQKRDNNSTYVLRIKWKIFAIKYVCLWMVRAKEKVTIEMGFVWFHKKSNNKKETIQIAYGRAAETST